MNRLFSSLSQRGLLNSDRDAASRNGVSPYGEFFRASSAVSTSDINFPKVIDKNDNVGEQTLYQVEIVNEKLLRKTHRSELAGKKKCLTRRWQTLLIAGTVIGTILIGVCAVAIWLSTRTPITAAYLLWGQTCTMNSRSCDATRSLWCPAGVCLCTGNLQWNASIENCTCGSYSQWNGIECEGYGYYGDPCNSVPCRPTLTCTQPANQTYSTGQDICICNNVTYLDTANGTCVAKLGYNVSCLTEDDCEDWLGLSCYNTTGTTRCGCSATAYWSSTAGTCISDVLGWQPCNATVPCDTSRGLSCVSGLCECASGYFWNNATTILECQQIGTYTDSCLYDFQCNTTVNLSCPSVSTGCNCYATSYAYICDCQYGNFWDGLQCTPIHTFNGTCPGQYACGSNLVCYLGHCICPGNMNWHSGTSNNCSCPTNTTWNSAVSLCE